MAKKFKKLNRTRKVWNENKLSLQLYYFTNNPSGEGQ